MERGRRQQVWQQNGVQSHHERQKVQQTEQRADKRTRLRWSQTARHKWRLPTGHCVGQARKQGGLLIRRFLSEMRRRGGLKHRGTIIASTLLVLLAVLMGGCTRDAGSQEPPQAEPLHQQPELPAWLLQPGPEPKSEPQSRVGEEFTVAALTPGVFTQTASFDAVIAGEATSVIFAEPGDKLVVTEVRDGWMAVEVGSGKGWMPEWYATGEASELVRIEPLLLSLDRSAALSLYPESGQAAALAEFDSAYSVQDGTAIWQWRDWYGIVLPLKQPYTEYSVLHPLLLWIKQSDGEAGKQVEEIEAGNMLGWKFSSIEARMQVVDVVLEAGMAKSPEQGIAQGWAKGMAHAAMGMAMDEVRQLLGEPGFTEASRSISDDWNGVHVGTDWHYQLPDARLVITWDSEGKLSSWQWQLPLELNPGPEYRNWLYYKYSSYTFSMSALIPSIEPQWLWRHRGELAYSYLLGEAAGMLLINGDDNKISGMHDNSNLFALDRNTGEKRWQIDAGFGYSQAVIDTDGKAAIILTHLSPEHQRYEERIRKVRLADGKLLWDKVLSQAQGGMSLVSSGSGKYVIHGEFDLEEGGVEVLSVLDAATGELKWQREMAEPFSLLNKGDSDPFILINNGQEITALDPESGKEKWHIAASEVAASEDDVSGGPDYGMFFSFDYGSQLFAPPSKERWYNLGGREHVLVETHTGKRIARYMTQKNEMIAMIDNRLWLINRAPDGSSPWESSSMNLTLYDAVAGRELWSIVGRGSGGAIDGDRLYLLLDGLPTALHLHDGSLIWQVSPPGSKPQTGFHQTRPLVLGSKLLFLHGTDLLMLNKDDGGGMYRVRDVLIGYPDGRDASLGNGILNADENGDLYVGAANTYFSRLRLP